MTASVASARARRRRRRLVRPLLWAALGAGVLALAGWVALGSSLFAVHQVTVRGEHLLSAAAVRQAAGISPGTAMLTLDTSAVRHRLTALPQVAGVQVRRDWPSTVHLDVRERTVVGALPAPAGVHLVAADGVVVGDAASTPAGVPFVHLPPGVALRSPTGRAALAVLAALPESLHAVVAGASAKSPTTVRLALSGGRTVVWGGAGDGAAKAAALVALLHRPASIYDVSAPGVVTTK